MDSEVSNQPSRRQVLGGIGAGIGATALTTVLTPAARAADTIAAIPSAVPDRATNFGTAWKFALVNAADITDPTGAFTNAPDPGFDDSDWRSVDLPHDWSIELLPVQQGSTSSGTGFFQGGLGWYRKTFTLPRSMAGKRISIEFDGVYSNASVYLNGTLLGTHPYAYTGFSFDLGAAHTDGVTPNVLAVRTQNQLPSSRWYSGSGIYRNVHLVVTDRVHVARHGTFVTTPDASTVHVDTAVANDSAAPVTAQVVATISDPAGRVVARESTSVGVAAGQSATGTITTRVREPRLWSTDDPNLYSLRTDVVVAGRITDTTTTTFGIRSATFDPDRGFSLNGEPMKLRGVDLHATQGPLGAVVHIDALRRQMTLMRSMGVNALRTAHNPPAPELVTVCEELGIVMMIEAFDCWHTGKVAFDYHLFFDEWSQSDITEMVNAHRNSPAVVLWSIGNETPDTGLPGGPAIAQRLIAAVRAADATRPVVMGSDQYRFVPRAGSAQDQVLRMLDGLGLNYNPAMSLDGLHTMYPDKFFFESESSSETSTRGVYQEPQLLNTGENHTPGKRSTSSYDNNLASWTMSGEYSLKKDRDRVFFLGQFLWSGQDYIGEPTPYDVFPVKASFFGATDTAGFAKDTYHLFRSQWTTTPMVHVVPMDWTNHAPGDVVPVWVYANVDTVELLLNGKSLGVRRFDHKVTTDGRAYLETTEPTGDDKNFPSGSYTSPGGSSGKLHLTWQVPFQPGRLVAVASSGGREVARDEVTTAGTPHAVRLSGGRAMTAGSLVFLTATVVDAHGVVVPGADDPIRITVTGPGRVAGVDNGRQESPLGYQGSVVPAFNGRAVVIVAATGGTGHIRVVATSQGLTAARTTMRATGGRGRDVPAIPAPSAAPTPATTGPVADASYSGAPDTVPAAMLDGDPATGWSNFYVKSATATLNAVSVSRPADWVSVTLPSPATVTGLTLTFTTSATLSLPATFAVSARDAVVRHLQVDRATSSGRPTTLTFDPIRTDQLTVTMTSPTPGTSAGFLRISEFGVVG
ncbi:MAG TPA: glycoside hydrolase family 2 TIM barrel-domain containing protein [Pseudonocardiaceae bacterium]|nr:glycoside hydrolase family 2 TIM barrel-domain containing protein [Pseudonocardiaceae bacterium]